MMQPIVTRAAVAMPHSSAPSMVAMAMSRGRAQLAVGLHDDPPAQVVLHAAPDAFRPGPIPRATPACLIDVSGLAPVPPS